MGTSKRFAVFYGSESDNDNGYCVVVLAPTSEQAESVVMESSPWADHAQAWDADSLLKIVQEMQSTSDHQLIRRQQRLALENQIDGSLGWERVPDYNREAAINALHVIEGAAREARR